MKYLVRWVDYQGNARQKAYKTIEGAIKKNFAVYGWFKNGECIRISDGAKIL